MTEPTDADRARLRAWLDRGAPALDGECGCCGFSKRACYQRGVDDKDAPVCCDNCLCGSVDIGPPDANGGIPQGVAWWNFERPPCVCHHGVVVVACEGGFRLVDCARCNASQASKDDL